MEQRSEEIIAESSPIRLMLALNRFDGWATEAEKHAASADCNREGMCSDTYQKSTGIPVKDRAEVRAKLLSILEKEKPKIAEAFKAADIPMA